MIGTTVPVAVPALTRLDWESRHFGLFAVQLSPADQDDGVLAAALGQARQLGVQLLVWPAISGRDVPQDLLDEFGGALVDRKATFRRPLKPSQAAENPPASVEFPIIPYPLATPSEALYKLAISAGIYSRFNVDCHFPRDKFQTMYRQWIERSVAKELAEMVLVAPLGQPSDLAQTPLGGMITLSISGGTASIGLVAVATEVRGMGIGSGLMRAAHGWMQQRRAREAQVVTQLANLPACRLYERAGYRLLRLQHYFHFWL